MIADVATSAKMKSRCRHFAREKESMLVIELTVVMLVNSRFLIAMNPDEVCYALPFERVLVSINQNRAQHGSNLQHIASVTRQARCEFVD